jgi:NADP-dependent 3-hydroxy acid dehydrogenase YdfG
VDIKSTQSIQECIDRCLETFGSLDILINAAGIDCKSNESIDKWEECITTNLIGLMKFCKLSLPYIQKKSTGCIINISSVAAHVATGSDAPCTYK